MALADFLGQLLGSVGSNVGNSFNQLSAFDLLGNQGVQQQQENQRQQVLLAQQLQLHNSMTPYESQSLALQSSAQAQRDPVSQQQKDTWDALMKGATIGQPGDPGAFQLGKSWLVPPSMATEPVIKLDPSDPVFKLFNGKISSLGQSDYTKYAAQVGEKEMGKAGAQQKQAAIEAMQPQIEDAISKRFSPQHYEAVYGKGNVDPEIDLHKQDYLNRLKTAIIEDKASGTTTRLQSLQKDLDNITPWESEFQRRRDRDTVYNQQLMTQGNQLGLQSYNARAHEMDTLAGPLDDTLQRANRLKMTLAAHTAQADAEAAPEFLSVMAGGRNTGLRMNQASIENTKEGRTAWEGLQSNINKWQAQPQHQTMPDSQRKAMSDLLDQYTTYVTQKSDIIRKARRDLSDTTNPIAHQKIFSGMEDSMHKLDTSAQTVGTAPPKLTAPKYIGQ